MHIQLNNQQITSITARMTLQIAPRELQLFQGQKEEYLRNPQQIINKRGFSNKVNTQEKILFLAPIIRSILCEVVSMLEKENILGNSVSAPTLTRSSESAKGIYNFAYKTACQYQLSPIKAHLVADAVIDNLFSTK
jgi:hypothetical protein